MKYERPELVAITAAVSAIHGQGKGSGATELSSPFQPSTAAYEADE